VTCEDVLRHRRTLCDILTHGKTFLDVSDMTQSGNSNFKTYGKFFNHMGALIRRFKSLNVI